MTTINYNSIQEIKNLLATRKLSLKKRYGQNFLISKAVREKLLRIISPCTDETVWEIGPGIGSLTVLCAQGVRQLALFEIDHGFIRFLREQFEAIENIEIYEGDFLKTGIGLLSRGVVPDKIFGNLPYSTGSTIVFRIIETGNIPEKLIFTLQREVCSRMTAQPGSKNYSLLSVVCQYAFHVRSHGDINPGSFYPVPDVVSRIVELTPHRRFDDRNEKERELFFMLSKDLFSSRRKTLRNNLQSGEVRKMVPIGKVLEACTMIGIDPGCRGETLSVDTIAALAHFLSPPA
jgi:16S rRNA (adenine1518-N6/adenine1519-N6)-dimethyltransferase